MPKNGPTERPNEAQNVAPVPKKRSGHTDIVHFTASDTPANVQENGGQ